MHKSRLAGFCIDCRTDDLDAATAFWSAALGLAAHRPDALRAEPLQPRDFGFDVVGLDVEVHAARMLDPLHLQMRLIGGGG